jgi:hypothetical protein
MQEASQQTVFCCFTPSLSFLLFGAVRLVVTSATGVILCKFSARYELMFARYDISHLSQLVCDSTLNCCSETIE